MMSSSFGCHFVAFVGLLVVRIVVSLSSKSVRLLKNDPDLPFTDHFQ